MTETIREQEEAAVPEQLAKPLPKAMALLTGVMVQVIRRFTEIELSIRYLAAVRVVLRQRGELEPAGVEFG